MKKYFQLARQKHENSLTSDSLTAKLLQQKKQRKLGKSKIRTQKSKKNKTYLFAAQDVIVKNGSAFYLHETFETKRNFSANEDFCSQKNYFKFS